MVLYSKKSVQYGIEGNSSKKKEFSGINIKMSDVIIKKYFTKKCW